MKAISAQVVSCCDYDKPQKIIQQMHGIIPCRFDCCSSPATKELNDAAYSVNAYTSRVNEPLALFLQSLLG